MALHREDGATAVVLALTLVVVISMMALAIDGGLLLTKYRRARNASDAAALAAALSCVRGEGLGAANNQANAVAVMNMAGATQAVPNVYQPSCQPAGGQVTVKYRAFQSLPFGAAVGLESPRPVAASATAIWGGAGGSDDVIPLVVFPNRLTTCGFNIAAGTYPAPGTQCAFWYDDKVIGDASWGLLNLASWGTTSAPSGCSNDGGTADIVAAISGELDEPLFLKSPPPTYVCGKNGAPLTPVDDAIASALASGRTDFVMPVNDESLQVSKCDKKACEPYKYAIVGFAFLKPVDIYHKNKKGDAAGYLKCAGADPAYPGSANAVCLVATWVGFSNTGLVPGGGPNYGLTAIGLKG